MTYLVDANVLSEVTKPRPEARVVAWPRQHEAVLAVDPVILGELRFGILLLHAAVDSLGHLLAPRVTAANEQYRTHVAELAKAVREETGQNV